MKKIKKILDKFWASSTHNKIAVGMVALGLFVGALIISIHFRGLSGEGPKPEMELGELWVGVGFFGIVAPLVVKWDERRLRRARMKEQIRQHNERRLK